MKSLGKILMIVGIIGTIYFGYKALDATKSLKVFGESLTISGADWTPVIVSVIVLVVGVVINRK